MKILVGAKAAQIAFGGEATAMKMSDQRTPWSQRIPYSVRHKARRDYCAWEAGILKRMLAAEMGSGPVYGTVQPVQSDHVWSVTFNNAKELRDWCRPNPAPDGSERHHRSCALRLGGNSCTC